MQDPDTLKIGPDMQPAREMPKAEVQNHLLKEKGLKVNMKPKLDTQEEGRDDALSDVLKSCSVSDLLNSLFVPSHKTLL